MNIFKVLLIFVFVQSSCFAGRIKNDLEPAPKNRPCLTKITKSEETLKLSELIELLDEGGYGQIGKRRGTDKTPGKDEPLNNIWYHVFLTPNHIFAYGSRELHTKDQLTGCVSISRRGNHEKLEPPLKGIRFAILNKDEEPCFRFSLFYVKNTKSTKEKLADRMKKLKTTVRGLVIQEVKSTTKSGEFTPRDVEKGRVKKPTLRRRITRRSSRFFKISSKSKGGKRRTSSGSDESSHKEEEKSEKTPLLHSQKSREKS